MLARVRSIFWLGRGAQWNQRLATSSDHPCPSLRCSVNGDFTGDISPIQSGKIAAVKREKEWNRLRTDAILNLLNMACNADEKRTLATSHTLIESRIDMRTRHRDGKSLSSKSKQGHQFLQKYYCCQLNGCANKAAHSHFINIFCPRWTWLALIGTSDSNLTSTAAINNIVTAARLPKRLLMMSNQGLRWVDSTWV